MMDFGLNKIFVEGEIDKRFIDAILKKHFQIEENELVISLFGKDNLRTEPSLIDQERLIESAKNLLIVDTDYVSKGGGRNKRLKEYNKIAEELKINFEIFLLPTNDETEGEVEDLIKTCFHKKFDAFDSCWEEMLNCFEKNKFEKPLNIPAKEGFLFSKIDLFKNYRETKDWKYSTLTKYDYSDEGIWNLDIDKNPKLEKLINFIKHNLFNN